MKKHFSALPLLALVAACGSDNAAQSGAAQIKIVGSSTVYPFTTAIAEQFQRANPGTSVIVESTGTGAGLRRQRRTSIVIATNCPYRSRASP